MLVCGKADATGTEQEGMALPGADAIGRGSVRGAPGLAVAEGGLAAAVGWDAAASRRKRRCSLFNIRTVRVTTGLLVLTPIQEMGLTWMRILQAQIQNDSNQKVITVVVTFSVLNSLELREFNADSSTTTVIGALHLRSLTFFYGESNIHLSLFRSCSLHSDYSTCLFR
ncbi:hypothetical protein PIB30_000696 [Stylosanthes scabra]|uniref:Uncharacterized protein n=1 Tax=Stylosanthes scabra TaxID=79078 RepID=A0ABU6Y0X3_9FABA|nr:hypothetical protein [Stylosanthes scabra]